MAHRMVSPFERIRKEDVGIVGGKNANLGEMASTGLPIPPGFATTAHAYRFFIEKNKLGTRISKELSKIKDSNDTKTLEVVGKNIRRMILDATIPSELADEIKKEYEKLGARIGSRPFVAVRSSATAEDLPGASFAGQQETFLNVRGERELLEKFKECIASLFTDRAIFYRIQKGFEHAKVALSVGVQKMVNSKSAGVMFTIDPTNGDDTKIVIEGNWGVGETVVQGIVTPDHFVFDKKKHQFTSKKIADKKIEWVRGISGHTVHNKVARERQKKSCLTRDELGLLAKLALRIEKHYGSAQDIEWAIDRDAVFPKNVFIVQSRPETVWMGRKGQKQGEMRIVAKQVIRGLAASPGIAAGAARIILNVEQINRVQEGDVLVTRVTSPDWVPAMKKARAIITEEGGTTSHAAIVSRELEIPCIVGTETATKAMKDGKTYTVDAVNGVVYEGVVEAILQPPKQRTVGKRVPTKTKIYMNLGVPEKIKDYAELPFDGIGLMRTEFIIASYVKHHPNDLIARGESHKYVDELARGIEIVAKQIKPRPVVVRFSDFKTNEYRKLKGGEKYEPLEENPMIGWRGVSRYVSPKFEQAFRLECRAIKKVREKMGCTNVWVMFPFVRTTWEVEKAVKIMEEEGLKRGPTFKVWIMLEVPSVVFNIDEFCKLPIDGLSIGSNDLTQLTLGADRDSEILGNMGYFNENDPAVMKALRLSVEGALRNKKTISICGQAPSVYPEIAEFLVRCGVTSVSINPDSVTKTRQIIAELEKKMKK